MKHTIFGLMSGSSLDGLDCACVTFEVQGRSLIDWSLEFTEATPLPQHFRELLPTLATASYMEVYDGHRAFGDWLGQQCKAFIDKHGISPDYIASHGHTVLHAPDQSLTLQVGDPKPIAQSTGCPVIYDFRTADVAAGGQGAPLAPVVEKYCFPGHAFYLNLGGIVNLSHHTPQDIRAWDLAPCNQLLNFLARRMDLPYDADGQLARSGSLLQDVLESLDSFIDLPVENPFSLDNHWIESHYFPLLKSDPDIRDLLHTSVVYIADAVGKQVRHLTSGEHQTLFVTGGGAYNSFLTERIGQSLPDNVQMVIPDNSTIDFKEAILIALCGLLRVLGLPNAFASVTGAAQDTINGAIWDPEIHRDD